MLTVYRTLLISKYFRHYFSNLNADKTERKTKKKFNDKFKIKSLYNNVIKPILCRNLSTTNFLLTINFENLMENKICKATVITGVKTYSAFLHNFNKK